MNNGPLHRSRVDAFTFEGEPLSGYWRHAAVVVKRSACDPTGVANYAVTVMTFGHLGLRVVDDQADLHAPLSGMKAPAIPGVVTIYPKSFGSELASTCLS